VHILLDYRPALRERTGVGEYVHELTRALAGSTSDAISIFTTSWKDRPVANLSSSLRGVRVVDRRLPVRGLIWMWHRLEWPPIEWLAGAADVVHAQSPLLIPTVHAAQVITIHDLDFLHHPERAQGEMRRDFPRLAADHARRADHVIVSSHYAAREIVGHLEIDPDKISVCSPGAPEWAASIAAARDNHVAEPTHAGEVQDPILFVGTINARKNITRLLEAYARLRQRRPDAPSLVLAGRAETSLTGDMQHVSVLGYVSDSERRALYERARMLVLPSLEEGFGLPVLEAMACGVPVVISNRGALPEVAGDAATAVDPMDTGALADEMERLLNPEAAREATRRGLARAAHYSWEACAAAAREAYRAAVATHARRAR
jgi:glycosyltransferase involved in cell wall biosynthesis